MVSINDTELKKLIQKHILNSGYTWSLWDIVKEYHKYRKGYYVSFTANDIIENTINPYLLNLP